MTAKKPSGEASMQRRRNQPASNSRPFQRSHQLTTTIASMTSPIPTMMRKPKKGMATGGAFSAGKSFRPCTVPFGSWVRMRLPRSGIDITSWFVAAASSGMAKRFSGTRLSVFQIASIAASFAG